MLGQSGVNRNPVVLDQIGGGGTGDQYVRHRHGSWWTQREVASAIGLFLYQDGPLGWWWAEPVYLNRGPATCRCGQYAKAPIEHQPRPCAAWCVLGDFMRDPAKWRMTVFCDTCGRARVRGNGDNGNRTECTRCWERRHTCEGCEKRTGDTEPAYLGCGACLAVHYCSPACQQQRWPVHRHRCQQLGKLLLVQLNQ